MGVLDQGLKRTFKYQEPQQSFIISSIVHEAESALKWGTQSPPAREEECHAERTKGVHTRLALRAERATLVESENPWAGLPSGRVKGTLSRIYQIDRTQVEAELGTGLVASPFPDTEG